MSTYRITDEPAPSASTRFVVDPKWPLFAVMFAGSWLSWPWFVWNAWALGSPSFRLEVLLAIVGISGNVVGTMGLLFLLGAELVPTGATPYMIIVLSAWKLLVSYQIFVAQARTFGLFETFGGTPKNGALLVFAGFMVRRSLTLPPLLMLVLG